MMAAAGFARFAGGGTLVLALGALRLAVGAVLVPFGLADAAVAVCVERRETLRLHRGARSLAVGGVDLAVFVRVHFREPVGRSEEHTSELQSLMRISYAVFCLKKKKKKKTTSKHNDNVRR